MVSEVQGELEVGRQWTNGEVATIMKKVALCVFVLFSLAIKLVKI